MDELAQKVALGTATKEELERLANMVFQSLGELKAKDPSSYGTLLSSLEEFASNLSATSQEEKTTP